LVCLFFIWVFVGDGIRKPVKKAVRWTAFRAWENPFAAGGIPKSGVYGCEITVAPLRNSGGIFLWLGGEGFERLNAMRTSIAADGLTEAILYFRQGRKCKRVPLPTP